MICATPTPQLQRLEPAARRRTLSVVIVVWNGKKYVLDCLESLKQHCSGIDLEVIVVDNASTDGTPDLVERRFPEFRLVRNQDNLGFSKANNVGMQLATGDFICLVNSDVKFTTDCFTPMLVYFAEHPEVAMVGPQSRGLDGEVKRSTLRFPTVWNQFCRSLGLDVVFKGSRLFGGLLMSDFDHRSTIPVEVLVGWFVMARRSAVDRVGLLDPRFFIYGEDVDWCYRFCQAGEKIVFFAETSAIHYGGGSSANAPLRFYLEQCFANGQYWRKHHGRFGYLAFLAISGVHQFVRLVGAVVSYPLAPTQRSQKRDKVRRSLACLRWLSQPYPSPLQMHIDPK